MKKENKKKKTKKKFMFSSHWLTIHFKIRSHTTCIICISKMTLSP